MAPHFTSADDFILTISDDDQNYPTDEIEEEATEEGPSSIAKKKRKRKSDEQDLGLSVGVTEAGSTEVSKKRKRNKIGPSEAKASRSRQSDQEETGSTHDEDDGIMDSDFEFRIGDVNSGVVEDFDLWNMDDKSTTPVLDRKGKGVDIDELIARRRKIGEKGDVEDDSPDESNGVESEDEQKAYNISHTESIEEGADAAGEDETMAEDGFGMGARSSEEESIQDGEQGYYQEPDSESDNESAAEPMPHPDDEISGHSSSDESNDFEESARRKAFFAPEEKVKSFKVSGSSLNSFQGMSLSRPILRGLASVGFSEPTPIQKKTIPIALLGRDIVGGAVTGSGKTAAFIVPILERLLYRPRKIPTSRVAILMPTRELAVQCFNVARKLASFTDVNFCQMVGGFSLREQESVLRSRPDVLIATPGRFIDHMRNSASFTVDTLEILVLDEADRMLEDGFADELNEILTAIPKSRQTMLFSATMTDRVDKLIRIGLDRPVRLIVDAKKQTVGTLVQEFVRLRPGREDKRLGYLLHLCENTYTEKTIIFFRQKKEAHRVRIIFGLCGLKASELHGNMTQEQRSASLASFRASQTTHLLATDVAARGLDIPAVSCVINYEAPQSPTIYLHRVGRTARAGRAGRACTLAAEPDRKVVKEVVKIAKAQNAKVVSRVIDSKLADQWAKKVEGFGEEVEAILIMEKEERAMGEAEREVLRGENRITFEAEIQGRPKRTWFESEKEKRKAKEVGKRELNGGGSEGSKRLSGKVKKKLDDHRERVEGRIWKKGKEREVANKGGKKKGVKGKSDHSTKGKGNPRGNTKGASNMRKKRE